MKETIIKFKSYDGYDLSGTLIKANKENSFFKKGLQGI